MYSTASSCGSKLLVQGSLLRTIRCIPRLISGKATTMAVLIEIYSSDYEYRVFVWIDSRLCVRVRVLVLVLVLVPVVLRLRVYNSEIFVYASLYRMVPVYDAEMDLRFDVVRLNSICICMEAILFFRSFALCVCTVCTVLYGFATRSRTVWLRDEINLDLTIS